MRFVLLKDKQKRVKEGGVEKEIKSTVLRNNKWGVNRVTRNNASKYV
jgi:hypothetical protein